MKSTNINKVNANNSDRFFQSLLLTLFIIIYISPLYPQELSIGKINFFQKNVTYCRDQYYPANASISALTGLAGQNVLWDLSPMRNEHLYKSDTLKIIPILDTFPYYNSYYDTSNILLDIASRTGGHYYFNFLENDNSIYYVGGNPFGVTGISEACFQRFIGQFPLEIQNRIEYGFNKSETINGLWTDASGSDEHYINGNIATIVDGQGKIVALNGDTIDNVLRIKKTIHYVDSNSLFGVMDKNDTMYTWYSALYSGPIISIDRKGFPLNYQYMTGVSLYVIDSSRRTPVVNKLLWSPNNSQPFKITQNLLCHSVVLRFTVNKPGNVNWHIYSLKGQLIKSSSKIFSAGQCLITINSLDIPSSTYLINIHINQGNYFARLVLSK